MTEAGYGDVGFALHRVAEHGHRIGVVEHDGVGTQLLHIAGDRQHGIKRAQGAEDAAGSARVADVGIDAVAFWE